jgi:GxxExxY protein
MGKLLYEEESFAIRHAMFEVYREMGNGLTEPVYQECVECELTLESIPFEKQKELMLTYKGRPLEKKYIPDLVCYGKIIVELKAVRELCPEHRAQVLNYLKITGLRLGLLVNFGHYPDVEIERIVL